MSHSIMVQCVPDNFSPVLSTIIRIEPLSLETLFRMHCTIVEKSEDLLNGKSVQKLKLPKLCSNTPIS